MTRAYLRLSLVIVVALAAFSGRQALLSVRAQSRTRIQAQAAAAGPQLPALLPSSLPIPRTWTPPDVTKIPPGPTGESILLGMHIFQETPRYASPYVGDKVSCGNCHIQAGTVTGAIPLVGAPAWFPLYSDRAKRMISLEDRIQECVTRSENGSPLPHGGPEMRGLLSFFDWLATSQPAGQPAPVRGLASLPDLQGDPARGATVYMNQCTGCHGGDGAGVPPILPPLWGPGAYNDGAGMNQVKKMAAFVVRNMPQNKPGTLTPQEAYDVSAYVASKPHPAYNHAYDNY
jgi:thiosulfate dehydrogenase